MNATVDYVHMLNATMCAATRVICAILGKWILSPVLRSKSVILKLIVFYLFHIPRNASDRNWRQSARGFAQIHARRVSG